MSNRIPFFRLITLTAAGACAAAAAEGTAEPPVHLTQFVVSASPFQRDQADLAQATSILAGSALLQRQQPTLGETLAGLPGVNSTWFGPGASRPVIRGLGGDRIRILENGTGTIDASGVSPDHAVSVEPVLIDRIEVVRGPASLLYGSSAVGGVVNLLTHRIETEAPERIVSGTLDARVGTGADEEAYGGIVNIGGEVAPGRSLVLHLDGFRRKTGDVDIPGHAESAAVRAEETEHALEEGEPAPTFARGTLPNSAVDSSGGAAGLSLVTKTGHAGFAYSGFDSLYGVPGHAHAGEAGVRIDLKQRRWDAQAETRAAFGPLSGARFKLGVADYEHRELEGDEVGTIIRNRGYDARAELLHQDLGGLAGAWGVQAGNNRLEAVGDEAFLPPSRTQTRAVFAFEEFRAGVFTPQFGARYEQQEIDVRDGSGRSRTDDAVSLSAGTVWNPAAGWVVGLSLTRTQRAPNTQELYADGPHMGTNAYEIGDAALARERSLGAELNLRRRVGFVTGEISVFANRFKDYLYEAPTGQVAVAHGDHFHFEDPADLHGHEAEEALTVYRYVATDADFYGAEAEAFIHLHEAVKQTIDLRLAADFTRAEDGAGRPLPRIPAARYTVGLAWRQGGWSAGADWQFTQEQDRVAANEAASGDYALLSAHVAWRRDLARGSCEVFLRGTNLTDEEARPHSSFLKDLAPLPGRNVTAGVRWAF